MEGYAKVARLMADHTELAIFRQFRALNMQNLLYQQAEIIHLADGLKSIVAEDALKPERRYYSQDWWSLSQSNPGDTEQWQTWLELQSKLDKYNDTLLKVTKVTNIGTPRKYDLSFLRDWLIRPTQGATPLMGLDRLAWDSVHDEDLVGIQVRAVPDIFSAWFTESVIPVYHNVLGKRHKEEQPDPEIGEGIFDYKDHAIGSTLSVLTTVVASILPLCSVVVLYTVTKAEIRLGLAIIFSACFSLALAIMTNGRKIEIFAATAAFAAVNVVFLANTETS